MKKNSYEMYATKRKANQAYHWRTVRKTLNAVVGEMSVEVERKFLCSADILKTLEEIGVCVGQLQFRDQYFDTPKFDLTLRDVWLRKRKGRWELKCPATVNVTEGTGGEQSKAQAALCTRYKEITNLPEIQLRVKEVIKDICADRETNSSQEDESWLSKMNLVCFAEFTTVRRSFTLEEEGVQIDLDQADFGYHVGEIEVLVPEGGDVQSALEKIERTARKLGLTGDQRVEGKMTVYLKMNHPEHYAKLLSEHVL
ncbi:thiamine-triphosphatase isoform X2 [Micropterus dolomieu]|uniref:thiamine-triphosphatase isoform X2 n=2 Tax=Micropterus dolomieu TaxID=147949 RepID=UPI001E8DD8F9|nr:thiamine-triphosphatase isoform X2 [Micropterus dolomieu]